MTMGETKNFIERVARAGWGRELPPRDKLVQSLDNVLETVLAAYLLVDELYE